MNLKALINNLILMYFLYFTLPVSAMNKPDHITDEQWNQLTQTIQQEIPLGQTNSQDIFARDGENSAFGIVVKITGNTALVSAMSDSDNGKNSGAVYLYELDSGQWQYKTKLKADDGKPNDYFGRSINIDNSESTIVINSLNTFTNTSAVYVFESACGVCGWTQTDKLISTDTQYLQSAVVSSSHIIMSTNSKLYFYQKNPENNWELQQTIIPGFSISPGKQSLSLSSNRLLVGSESDSENGINAGAVYVYDFDGIWSDSFKILPSDNGQAGAKFGTSLKLSGNRAIIGAPNENNNTGSAYIMELSNTGISSSTKLVDTNAVSGSFFGGAVSLFDDIAVVSATNTGVSNIYELINQWSLIDSINGPSGLQKPIVDQRFNSIIIGHTGAGFTSGTAEIYKLSEGVWEVDSTLQLDASAGDEFGIAISVSGDRAVIGAHKDNEKGINAGAAYVYEYIDTQWKKIKKIVAADGQAGDEFGRSVSLDGDRIVVGAPRDDLNMDISDAGSVYIFELINDIWQQHSKITSAEGVDSDGDLFGFAVSHQNDRILVGAFLDDDVIDNSGAVFVFDYDGNSWNVIEKISNPNIGSDGFGYAVSLDGEQALIGAFGDDEVAANSGAAYIFNNDGGWQLVQKLTPTLSDGGFFGAAVSLDGNQALVGAFLDDANNLSQQGSAYVFESTDGGSSWGFQQQLLASDAQVGDQFGYSVKLLGDQMLIGAWRDNANANSGSAYLFKRNSNNWTQSELINPASQTNSFFGVALDMDNKSILIGAHRYNSPSQVNSGLVYAAQQDLIFKNGFE